MNPSDANSPLTTLRQLKEMLDAGTLTPQEFEALKQQLVFGNAAPTVVPASSPVEPVEPSAFVPLAPLVEESPSPEVSSTASSPDWLAAAAPPLLAASMPPASYPTEADERRNPLTLVFAIGGALVLLGIIIYLVMGRPTSADEHLTSATQTAADSTAVAPEVGPQAQQITLPPVAAPETIRVAPAQPLPTAVVPERFRTDSVAAPAAVTPKPVAPATPAKTSAPARAAAPATAAPDTAAAKTGQP